MKETAKDKMRLKIADGLVAILREFLDGNPSKNELAVMIFRKTQLLTDDIVEIIEEDEH